MVQCKGDIGGKAQGSSSRLPENAGSDFFYEAERGVDTRGKVYRQVWVKHVRGRACKSVHLVIFSNWPSGDLTTVVTRL